MDWPHQLHHRVGDSHREEVLAGTFFLNKRPIIILFDSRASHDFMNSTCAKKAKLPLVVSGAPYVISTPLEVEWMPTE
jgi:16S rRNA A1518/A1519 N6-dimethyltransferase RsmA/KsgA/DIM1 with predicted DNA glycosylase/AP lyase activity